MVDLLNVAVTAGHGLHQAVAVVGRAGRGPLAAEFAAITARTERGSELRTELMRMPETLGDDIRPLVVALCAALGSGSPLGPQLQRLAERERLRERRRREERARRLPVVLLGPLVGLILPAFVLLSVAPIALSTLGGITDSTVLPAPAISGPLRLPPSDHPRSPP